MKGLKFSVVQIMLKVGGNNATLLIFLNTHVTLFEGKTTPDPLELLA